MLSSVFPAIPPSWSADFDIVDDMPAWSMPDLSQDTLLAWHEAYVREFGVGGKGDSSLYDLAAYLRNRVTEPSPAGLVQIDRLLRFFVARNPSATWSFPVLKASLVRGAAIMHINWSGLPDDVWAVWTTQFKHACSHLHLLRRDQRKRARALKTLPPDQHARFNELLYPIEKPRDGRMAATLSLPSAMGDDSAVPEPSEKLAERGGHKRRRHSGVAVTNAPGVAIAGEQPGRGDYGHHARAKAQS